MWLIKHMKLKIRIAASLNIALLFALSPGYGGARDACAQSSRQNPIALTTNQIDGQEEPRGQSQFYAFDAGPGDVTATLDGMTDFYSSNMRITMLDETGRELAVLPMTATGLGSKQSVKMHLSRRQPIVMQVNVGLAVGVHLKYHITLTGPTFPPGENALASATPPQSSPPTAPASVAPIKTQINIIGTPAPIDGTPVPNDGTPIPIDGPVASALPESKSVADKRVNPDAQQQAAMNAPVEDKWALVIGVSKFQKPGVDLRYSSKDARDLRNYLVEEGNFAPDHVKLLVDEEATKERVLAELGDKWLPRVARPNDLVLIFISSHGSPSNMDVGGLNYLVMHNTDPDSLFATGLPLQELASAIKQRVHSNRVVMIIDACHSGAANTAKGLTRVGNVDTDTLLQGTGQLVICSSEPTQVSWESKRYQNGVFTHQLINALRAQKNKGTLSQVFDQMRESVESEVLADRSELQTPVLKSKWLGNDLIISVPPSKPRPLPADMKRTAVQTK